MCLDKIAPVDVEENNIIELQPEILASLLKDRSTGKTSSGQRIKHILECQVFGFAPTQIIFDIAMSYIFGFDEGANKISRRNFFAVDTLPWAEKGELQKLVNEKLGDRLE